MFKKILIANRGEIAVRIIRACKEMGVQTVAVFSSADRGALHTQLADEAYCIGGPAPRDSYLNEDAIITCALAAGAAAIHPGYGFLSENAAFARRCQECGLVFIGPSAEVIERMGDKDAARRTARAAGVPIVPGCDLLASPEDARREAERIGCPVLIKARSGGGGRGIRRVDRAEDAAAAFVEAQREAAGAFGDGACYMEKLIAPAHHVEVQVLADTQGTVITLGERECSVQRRNQKLIEESPAPCLEGRDGIREQMAACARALAQAVDYTGAGTVEYLYTDDGRFYFMEMNTRLQVEHPVTEFVTEIDLVKWQLRIAAGRPIRFTKDAIDIHLHAIECRINAEGPDMLPSAGTVTALHTPGGPSVRFDTALFAGAQVPPFYDSLLGKLIVCSGTRDEAIRKMRAALAELDIEGVAVNTDLMFKILEAPAFAQGRYHTNLMEALDAH